MDRGVARPRSFTGQTDGVCTDGFAIALQAYAAVGLGGLRNRALRVDVILVGNGIWTERYFMEVSYRFPGVHAQKIMWPWDSGLFKYAETNLNRAANMRVRDLHTGVTRGGHCAQATRCINATFPFRYRHLPVRSVTPTQIRDYD